MVVVQHAIAVQEQSRARAYRRQIMARALQIFRNSDIDKEPGAPRPAQSAFRRQCRQHVALQRAGLGAPLDNPPVQRINAGIDGPRLPRCRALGESGNPIAVQRHHAITAGVLHIGQH